MGVLNGQGVVAALDAAGELNTKKVEYDLTVDTAADETDYEFQFDFAGEAVYVTYTSGTGATTSSIATGIANAINTDTDPDVLDPPGVVSSLLTASDAAAVVTFTADEAGLDFDMSTSDPSLTLSAKGEVADTTLESELADKWELLIGDEIFDTVATSQDDYAPAGIETSSVILINCTLASNITGIQSGNQRSLTIVNTGAFNLTLKHQNAGSSSENRIIGTNGADVILQNDEAALLLYDDTNSRWRVV